MSVRELVWRFIPTALRRQRKAIRRIMNRPRPIRCPKCEQYTQQDFGKNKKYQLGGGKIAMVLLSRVCRSCKTEFTRAQSRKALKLARAS